MVFSAQIQRTLRVATNVVAAGGGLYAIFLADYEFVGFEGRPHVFTNIQRDSRKYLDGLIYGIDHGKIEKEVQQQQQLQEQQQQQSKTGRDD